MLKKTNIPALLCALFLAAACGDSNELPQEPGPNPDPKEEANGNEEDGTRIILGTQGVDAVLSTRALDDFPNGGRIGVVAAYADPSPIDWRSFPDILGAAAVADSYDNGIYTFEWVDGTKYWPFDNSELVFLGYSPDASVSPAVQPAYDPRYLVLNLIDDMPEVLYASGNAEMKTYRKNPLQTVDLGTFRHALSQLTIEIAADASMNPGVRITSLTLSTERASAVLDLLAADNGVMTLSPTDFEYKLVENQSVRFTESDPYKKMVMFYPGTENFTHVNLTLTDGVYSIDRTYAVSQFPNVDKSGNFVALEEGLNTTVRLLIKGTLVPTPENRPVLEGQITDWVKRGNFEININ